MIDPIGRVEASLASISSALADIVEQRKIFPIDELPRLIGDTYAELPESDLYELLYGSSEPLKTGPGFIGLRSMLCTQLHFSLDEFRHWMMALDRRPRLHRKDWEWFYIVQALFERDLLKTGSRGLVFAVGREPLPSLLSKYGCEIIATDQAPEAAAASGWGQGNMYSPSLDDLHHANIVDRETFIAHVRFEYADMNDIPLRFANGFDFCWSSCAFEHLGSIEHGLRFVERSIDTLKPGGIAIHTTEFNVSSNDITIETPGLSIYRRNDIEELIARLERAGHYVEPVDWRTGHGVADRIIDQPPYRQSPNLKVSINDYDCTSIGLIIRKGASAR